MEEALFAFLSPLLVCFAENASHADSVTFVQERVHFRGVT